MGITNDDYIFKISVQENDQQTWHGSYSNALLAVHAYDSFKDCGDADERIVNLYEPTGKCWTKIFKRGVGLVSYK